MVSKTPYSLVVLVLLLSAKSLISGGERGIRTLGTLTSSTVFETAPFDHSGISPALKSACSVRNHGGQGVNGGKTSFYPMNPVDFIRTMDILRVSVVGRIGRSGILYLCLKRISYVCSDQNRWQAISCCQG